MAEQTWPRWLKFLLVGSLAVNLLGLGLLGGLFWRFADDKGHERHAARGEFALVAALTKEDRRAVLRDMRAKGRAGADARKAAFRNLRSDLLTALRAENFDTDAVAGLLSRHAELGNERQANAQTVWLARLANMPADARRAYADRLERWYKRGKHKRKD